MMYFYHVRLPGSIKWDNNNFLYQLYYCLRRVLAQRAKPEEAP